MIPPSVAVDPSLPPAVAGPAFLRDGTEVWVRPFHADDQALVRGFLEHEATGEFEPRHFALVRTSRAGESAARRSSPAERLTLIVLGDRAERVALLGLGEYVRLRSDSPVAEVAFWVAADFRGRGIASLLLARLARAALAYGLLRFEVRLRAQNPEMLELFRGSGLPFTEPPDEGEVDVFIPLAPDVGTSGSLRPGLRDPVEPRPPRRRRTALSGRQRRARPAEPVA
jgi:GNAT superfamily N-acetyltransferase